MIADSHLLEQTAERLMADHVSPATLAAAERGEWPDAAWQAVEQAGLTRALVPEEAGGFGMDAAEALVILRVAGAHALPLPLAETMLAAWLLAGAGIAVPDGPLSCAPVNTGDKLTLRRDGAGWWLAGIARRVPWGAQAEAVAALADAGGTTMAVCVPTGGWSLRPGGNLAREPRDTLTFDVALPADAVAPAHASLARMRAMGAAMRSLQMAGAMQRIVAMTTQYALDRTQFGRPIGKFQAVQQNLAVLAAQQAAASAAADLAAAAVAEGVRMLPIAAAKIRTGEAAGIAASIAHQVHGAIGFTYEHSLHFLTKRLWAWREEFGNEAEWSALLGQHVIAAGADALWAEITAA